MARVSILDALRTLRARGVPGMLHREEGLGKTQDMLDELGLSAGLELPWVSCLSSWWRGLEPGKLQGTPDLKLQIGGSLHR